MMKFVDGVLKVGLWFAWLAEKILFFFLHNWAYFCGLLISALVLVSHWVALTVTNRLSGLHAPLLGYVIGKPGSPDSLVGRCCDRVSSPQRGSLLV